MNRQRRSADERAERPVEHSGCPQRARPPGGAERDGEAELIGSELLRRVWLVRQRVFGLADGEPAPGDSPALFDWGL